MLRLVSLFPAATDAVAELGLAHWLVGVDHRSDHPSVAGLPRLSALALALPEDPAGVDAAMAEAQAAGLSPWRLDAKALAELRPDVVLVQDTCGLCALDLAAVAPHLPTGAALWPIRLEGLAEVGPFLVALGDRLGEGAAGQAAAGRWAAGLARVRSAVGHRVPRRVALLEWVDPPWVAGHWGPELVALAGGVDLLGEAGAPSRRLSWAQLRACEPEVVLVAPCGEGLAVAQGALAALRARPELQGWAENAAWWALDADRLSARLGPGSLRGLEVMAALIHPEAGLPQPGPGEAWRA